MKKNQNILKLSKTCTEDGMDERHQLDYEIRQEFESGLHSRYAVRDNPLVLYNLCLQVSKMCT